MPLADRLASATTDFNSKVDALNKAQANFVATQSAFSKTQTDATQITKDLHASHDSDLAIVDAVLKPLANAGN